MTPLISPGWNFYDNFPTQFRGPIHEFVKHEVAEAVAQERREIIELAEKVDAMYDVAGPGNMEQFKDFADLIRSRGAPNE